MNKFTLITGRKLVLYLSKWPFFKRVFYLLHMPYELLTNSSFTSTNRYVAAELANGLLFGAYAIKEHPTWKVMVEGEFEPNGTKIVTTLAKKFSAFIDIGAHLGYYSLLVNGQKKIATWTFEPNPVTFKKKEKNIEVNNLSKISLINAGLGKEKKSVTMYGESGMSTVVKGTLADLPKQRVKVPIQRLDDYSNTIPDLPMMMKVDIEGGEFDMLQGATKFFETHDVGVVLIEIVKYWSGGINPHFEETFDWFMDKNYHTFTFDEGMLVEVNEKEIPTLRGGNYLFVQKKHRKILKSL